MAPTLTNAPGRAAYRWVLAAALLLALLELGSHTEQAHARVMRTGVSGLVEYEPLAFARIRQAGARFVRIAVDWQDIAPASQPADWNPEDPADPHYDWQRTDAGVTGSVAEGLIPVLMIEEAPQWAEGCDAGDNCKPNATALAAFATAAARRYAGNFGGLPRVRYWQGLNEPNLSIYFNPQFEGDRAVSPELYRSLAEAFYAAIKAVDPSNLVLLAGLGPIAVPKYTIGPMRFTRELLCMKGKENFRPAPGNCHGGLHFDIFDIHPYTTGGPNHPGGANDVEMGDLPKLKRLLGAADRAGRIKGAFKHTPLWVGEFSWDSNPPDPGGLPINIEKRWVAEALFNAWRAGVRVFFWFSLRDRMPQPNLPFSQTIESGLYFRGASLADDQPKPFYYAFRFPFVAYPRAKGLYCWGRTPFGTRGKLTIQVRRGGKWRRIGLVHTDKAGFFHGLLPSHYGRNRQGLARAVYQGQATLPFSMRPIPDFVQPPFG